MKKEIIKLVKSLIIASFAALIIVTFVFRPVAVEGISMYPTLNNSDRLILDKVTYYFRKPKAGDIVIVKYPSNEKEQFIKRVIAVGGDKIKIENHKLYINGARKDEKYIFEQMNSDIDENFTNEIEVPKGSIFVMGDNRNDSKDSRFADVGFIDLDRIIGRAVLRVFPFKNIGVIK